MNRQNGRNVVAGVPMFLGKKRACGKVIGGKATFDIGRKMVVESLETFENLQKFI
jgi:hypothetical protein